METFSTVFASVFNTDDGPWDASNPVLEENDWGDDDKLLAESELVWGLMLHGDAHKSTGLDGIHHSVLKLDDVTTGLLFIIFQWSGESGEVSVAWELANVFRFFKKAGRKTLVITACQSHFSTAKIMDKVYLGVTEKQLRDMQSLVTTSMGSRGESPA